MLSGGEILLLQLSRINSQSVLEMPIDIRHLYWNEVHYWTVCVYYFCKEKILQKYAIHSMIARVRAFISTNDSVRYRQLQQQSVRNVEPDQCCYQVSSTVECSVYVMTDLKGALM
jgi:hypothetical protein